MKPNEKDIFLGDLKSHLSGDAGHTTKPKFKRTRFLAKLSPMGITLFAVAIAAGVLISSFFTVYYVNMSGELNVVGSEAPLFYWDNTVPFIGDTCATPLDVTDMVAGDIEVFPHNILNADAGYWRVTFDTSEVTYTDPLSPEFGFYFSIVDYAIDGVPCTLDDLVIGPGEKAQFKYRYEIDHEMVTPPSPLDVSIGATIAPYVEILNAVDDTYTIITAGGDMPVLVNDDTGMFGVDITEVITTDPLFVVTIVGDHLHFEQSVGFISPGQFDYVIADKLTGLVTDTGTVYYHL